jgi:hypothetical protein
MKTAKVVILTAVLLVLGVFYKRFKNKIDEQDALSDYNIVKQFLLNDSSLATSSKPLLWLHTEHAPNARNWESFYSRMNTKSNQPYMLLTIKSVIDTCGDSFNICLIDDESFKNIIPGWDVDLSRIGNPLKRRIRELALMKLLYYYGGLVLPTSFLAIKDLGPLYEKNTADGRIITAEAANRTISGGESAVFPSVKFIGCQKDSVICKELVEELERNVSFDMTDMPTIKGNSRDWLHNAAISGKAKVVPGQLVGTVDVKGDVIGVEELLGQSKVNLNKECFGVMIPSDEILKRTSYNWFVRMSPKQVVESNTFIGKMALAVLSN